MRRISVNLRAALLLLALFHPVLRAADGRPNIVLIMADDMGYSDIGCYGSEIATPNIDRLAVSGIRYTQFYNAARCCPTRASLLTGLYPHQTGIGNMVVDQGLPAYRGDLNENCVTIAQVLRGAGYRTMLAGKWHLTKHTDMFRDDLPEAKRRYTSKDNWPLQRGFDDFFGTIHGAGSYYEPATLVSGNDPVTALPDDFYYTDAITGHAVAAINRHAGEAPGQPFFAYIAYTAPHWPLQAPPGDIALYAQTYAVGWDVIRQRRLDRMKLLGILGPSVQLSPRHPKVPAWEDEPDKDYYARCMAVYAAQIHRMDEGIGRIIDCLDKQGLRDNTIILFLSDNGACAEIISADWPPSLHMPRALADGSPIFPGMQRDHPPGPANTYASYGVGWANASDTPFTYFKHYIQEGGIATPLIVSWPAGILPSLNGSITGQIGHVKDIMPTLLEAAGCSYPAEYNGHPLTPLAGVSLLPNFRGGPVDAVPVFWEHHGNRGMRTPDWKIVSINNGPWRLHDMVDDRIEGSDRAAGNPELVQEMIAAYSEWAKAVGVVEKPPKPKKK